MTRPSHLLPTSSAQELAIKALAGQGQYGTVTSIAAEYGVGREQVYRLREHARAALKGAFKVADPDAPRSFMLEVTEEDMVRTVIGLRVVTPSSIRDEVAMLPIIYGFGWSFGKIQGILTEAGARAAAFHAGVDLSGIKHVALDEMFSQGKPVFAGIDLDTQYLFQLGVHSCRTGEEWETSLVPLRDEQNLYPDDVTKDAGGGLRAGVEGAWPEAGHNDDSFHALRAMSQEAYHLERRAYAAMARVEELERKRAKAKTGTQRRSLGQQLRRAREHERHAIKRFDVFEAQRREAQRVLDLADRGSGQLRQPAEVRDTLRNVADQMKALGGKRVRKVARYLRNRAEGLARYLDDLGRRLEAKTEEAGGPKVVEAVVRAYQASFDQARGGPAWDRKARETEMREATRHLVEVTQRDSEQLLRAVSAILPVLSKRYRASSAIENLNSVLRPYLVVQKSTSQAFLDLFRFYWNTRIREWGPHKGTSAYESLTGEHVEDWLSLLGYPPGRRFAAAA